MITRYFSLLLIKNIFAAQEHKSFDFKTNDIEIHFPFSFYDFQIFSLLFLVSRDYILLLESFIIYFLTLTSDESFLKYKDKKYVVNQNYYFLFFTILFSILCPQLLDSFILFLVNVTDIGLIYHFLEKKYK